VTPRPRVVRVLPEGTIDKTFDYLVPEQLGDQVRVGTLVRVELNRRRVRAWVVADDVEPPAGVTLRPLAKVTGWGPPPELVDLAAWAAWRWAGRRSWFLGTASPPGAVTGLPVATAGRVPVPNGPGSPVDELAVGALDRARSVVRLPPLTDPFPLVVAAIRRGPTLVLTPAVAEARRLGARLRRTGIGVAVLPGEWASARAGVDVVVGARAAAWGPVPGLAAAVVLDEHDESYQEEQTTTWHARDVVAERARRAGAPCMLVSPTPTLESLAWAEEIVVPARRDERAGWPILDVVDRRKEDPGRTGLYSERLVTVLRSGARVVCVLNRKGRARLLACARCGESTRCERCSAAVAQQGDGTLVCRRCGTTRPVVCQSCGTTKLKNLRVGVTRAREELEALVREPVAELSGAERPGSGPVGERIVVGTEAALHQVDHADVVAFLDIDQELLAPRYRAAEQALALLVRGARLLGRSPRAAAPGRAGGGRLLVQTRLPQHEVLQAVLHADPTKVADAERARRELLRFPPVAALAAVSGPAASPYVEGLQGRLGVEVLGPSDGVWLVRADDHVTLADALQDSARPATGRLRIEVDPQRL
jgi:primosomal protein N' (replication factor Y)